MWPRLDYIKPPEPPALLHSQIRARPGPRRKASNIAKALGLATKRVGPRIDRITPREVLYWRDHSELAAIAKAAEPLAKMTALLVRIFRDMDQPEGGAARSLSNRLDEYRRKHRADQRYRDRHRERINARMREIRAMRKRYRNQPAAQQIAAAPSHASELVVGEGIVW